MTEAENDVLTATAYAFLHHHCSIGYTYRTRLWSSRRNHLRSWMSQRYQDVLGWLCKRHHKVAVNILLSTDHTTISWTLICVTWGLESIPHAGSVNKTRCPFRPWLESISERIYAPPNWTISVNQWRSGRTFVALNAYGNVNISTFKIRKMEDFLQLSSCGWPGNPGRLSSMAVRLGKYYLYIKCGARKYISCAKTFVQCTEMFPPRKMYISAAPKHFGLRGNIQATCRNVFTARGKLYAARKCFQLPQIFLFVRRNYCVLCADLLAFYHFGNAVVP